MRNTPIRKIIKPFLISLIVLVLGLLALTALIEKNYVVEKNIEIKAPSNQVMSLLEDFSQWQKWSPWHEVEPHALYQFDGPMGQLGSSLQWDGKIIGKGSLTLIAKTPTGLTIRMQMIKPRPYTVEGEFLIETLSSERTRVSWKMSGELRYPLGRIFSSEIKEMMSRDMERGLHHLQKTAQKP